MKIKLFIYLFLAMSFMCSCSDDVDQGAISFSLHNFLTEEIDTLSFEVNTPTGVDSMLFTVVGPSSESEIQFFDQLNYYFIEEEDIFIISKGFFKIGGTRYDLSNCFCDPNLKEGMLSEGTYSIDVLEIDELRSNVEYIIKKK